MPYVITTHCLPSAAPTTTRRAVATLEEAFNAAPEPVRNAFWAARLALMALPESGGTVGPLPDGTVIEVERVWWPDLADAAGMIGPHQSIIDAYNARA